MKWYVAGIVCEMDWDWHRKTKNRQAKSNWLAWKFVYTIRHNPDMKSRVMIGEAIQK